MSWQIKDYKAADSTSAVVGHFTIETSGMEIRGFTHFKGDDGSQWESGPQRGYVKDGQKKYYQFVYFPEKARWGKFKKWALSEIDKLAPATADPVQGDDGPPF